jgi:hypothetical protein
MQGLEVIGIVFHCLHQQAVSHLESLFPSESEGEISLVYELQFFDLSA